MISPPEYETLNSYYKSYWKLLAESDLLAGLVNQTKATNSLLSSIPPEKENYRYEPQKWMVKEVIGHLADVERILTYRALRYSRNDSTVLPGFDENQYISESNYQTLSLDEIGKEWQCVRNATLSLFQTMKESALDNTGIANGISVSPRILLYFILVHERHHIGVLKERYFSRDSYA